MILQGVNFLCILKEKEFLWKTLQRKFTYSTVGCRFCFDIKLFNVQYMLYYYCSVSIRCTINCVLFANFDIFLDFIYQK